MSISDDAVTAEPTGARPRRASAAIRSGSRALPTNSPMTVGPLTHGTDWGVSDSDGNPGASRPRGGRRTRRSGRSDRSGRPRGSGRTRRSGRSGRTRGERRTRRSSRRVAAAFEAMAGQAPPRPPVLHIITATLALMVPLIVLGAAADATHLALLIPPMAATAALIIGGPDLPLAQPRNVILGHLVGGGTGLALHAWLGPSVLVGGVAAGVAFGAMLMLRCAHSPGAATAMLIVTLPPAVPWRFMVVLMGSAVLVIAAGLVANRARRLRYPAYWW